jgi:uncharacterized membrane protein
MKKHSRTVILVLAIVALVASLTSLYVHYKILTDPGYTSFCDVSATVSCEAVYQSAYGTVAGIPVAAGGAIWAGLVLVLALGMRGPRQAARDAGLASYIFVLATIGLAAVLYFGYASFFVLNKLCLLCLTMYVAVIGIFIVSGAAAAPIGSLPSRLGNDLRGLRTSPLALGLALAWLGGSVSVVAFFPRELNANTTTAESTAAAAAAPEETLTADEIADFERWLAQQPRLPIEVDAQGAKVVVVKFNDYQCPACRQTYIAYKGLKAKYEKLAPGQVRFVTVDYPLDSECNTGGIHGAACEAAAAVRMAKAKNRGEAMEEWLFDNQARLTRDVVEEGVREVAQVTDFDAQYAKTLEGVRTDAQKGQKLQISGTPTFFINGIRIGGGLRPAYFDAAIAYELKHATN